MSLFNSVSNIFLNGNSVDNVILNGNDVWTSEIPLPFDVTANWSLTTPLVVDEDSFITFLESNNLTNVVITDFSLVDGRLTCNLIANGLDLSLDSLEVTNVVAFGNIIGLENIYLTFNQLVTFNPTLTLPKTLLRLYLGVNQIVTFDPTISLPNSLIILDLGFNQIVTFDPTLPLPSSLQQLFLASNQLVNFNPSIALPDSISDFTLNNNQITTAGFTASEPWANAMSVIFGRGFIDLTGNVDTAGGTNLRTILLTKGWSVNA